MVIDPRKGNKLVALIKLRRLYRPLAGQLGIRGLLCVFGTRLALLNRPPPHHADYVST